MTMTSYAQIIINMETVTLEAWPSTQWEWMPASNTLVICLAETAEGRAQFARLSLYSDAIWILNSETGRKRLGSWCASVDRGYGLVHEYVLIGFADPVRVEIYENARILDLCRAANATKF
jgi:hypothetical protein